MKKISSVLENQIVEMTKKKNKSAREIARILGICHRTVLQVRKRKNISIDSAKKSRRSLLTERDARAMEHLLVTKQAKTPKEAAAAINKPVSEWTARRALKRIELTSAIKQKKPALSEKNIKARLKFCKEHKNWSVEDWKRVIWSDETKINRFQSDGKEYYWHRPYETLKKHQVKETMKHGGGSLMVWACFTWWHLGPVVKIEGIMKKEDYLHILTDNLPDFVDHSAYPEEEVVFQQDGDPKHTAKIVKDWLSNQKFHTMQWPAQSPDLNPIENLWALLIKRLSRYDNAPTNLNELWARVQTEWSNIPRHLIENLVESMPRRVRSVIKAKGLWTKY